MKVLIAGGGIGGLATALSLHAVGIEAQVFEQAGDIREIGVGINMLPHAVKNLAALGLLPALDRAGVRIRELIYMNRLGQAVWREPRGLEAGYDTPQFSIHRGKLLGALHQAAHERLGPAHIHTDCRLVDFDQHADRVVARFERRDGGERIEAAGDALIGADGIHSTVRSRLYPDEGSPVWSGMMLWRGATEWAAYRDGRTMMIAGGSSAKFVFYPIHADPAKPDTRLTNWAVMARTGDGTGPPPRREDWNRVGRLDVKRAGTLRVVIGISVEDDLMAELSGSRGIVEDRLGAAGVLKLPVHEHKPHRLFIHILNQLAYGPL